MSYRDDFKGVQSDAYWSLPRAILFAAVFMIALYGIGFLATGGDLAIYSFWAPKRANAERKVFVETNSYVQGKVSQLTQLQLDYENAEGPQKAALRTVILIEASQVEMGQLPVSLQAFVSRVRSTN